jgi:hypothetical protein
MGTAGRFDGIVTTPAKMASAIFLDFRSGGRLKRVFSAVYGRFTQISTAFSQGIWM